MKTKIWLVTACIALTALGIVFMPEYTSGRETTRETAKSCHLALYPQYDVPCETPPKTLFILNDLIRCESQGKETAINPKDSDGKPSYGLLQFRPSTLLGAIRKYDLMPDLADEEIMNVMLFGNLQIRAFLAMYGEGKPKEWWQQQFPQCSKNYGYWL